MCVIFVVKGLLGMYHVLLDFLLEGVQHLCYC